MACHKAGEKDGISTGPERPREQKWKKGAQTGLGKNAQPAGAELCTKVDRARALHEFSPSKSSAIFFNRSNFKDIGM